MGFLFAVMSKHLNKYGKDGLGSGNGLVGLKGWNSSVNPEIDEQSWVWRRRRFGL